MIESASVLGLLFHERLMLAHRKAHGIPIGSEFRVLSPHFSSSQLFELWGVKAHTVPDFTHGIQAMMQHLKPRSALGLPGLPGAFGGGKGKKAWGA